jgi:PAS domain S-box-containing protein
MKKLQTVRSWVHRKKPFSRPFFYIHLCLVGTMLFAFGLCLWLFLDISANHRKFQGLLSRSPLNPSALESLQSLYQHELWLDLLLALLVVVFAMMILVFVSFYLQTVRKFKDVQSMDTYIIQSITRGVLTVDEKGRVTSCNQAMREILEIETDDSFGRPVEALLPPSDPILRMLLNAVESNNRQEEEEEISYTRADGESVSLRVTILTLRDEEGRSIGNIVLVKDLSPLRLLEERVRRHERLAALGSLTRRIIHEIRNPLSAMDLNLQLLQEHLEGAVKGKPDEKVSHYFSIVFSELSRLNAILEDTHLSVDPVRPEKSPLDLHQLVRDVAMGIDAEVRHAGHVIEVDLGDFPACILGDRNLLVQVFVNLFKNALEAMSEKPGALRVSSRQEKNDQVVIQIEDNGRGIDWQDLNRIFDPYFTTKKKGTGLGLSIVHNIMTQHGGDIQVGSWLGEGTLFDLSFPLHRQDTC